MNRLTTEFILCPYCGEGIELVIDCSLAEQEYIEDCEVCCRPIHLSVYVSDEAEIQIFPKNENE